MGQKELKDHPEYVVWKLATEERSFQQIQDSLLLRIQGYEQQLEKDWFLSGNPKIKALPIPLLPKDHKNAEVWESASYSDGRKILAFGAALEHGRVLFKGASSQDSPSNKKRA